MSELTASHFRSSSASGQLRLLADAAPRHVLLRRMASGRGPGCAFCKRVLFEDVQVATAVPRRCCALHVVHCHDPLASFRGVRLAGLLDGLVLSVWWRRVPAVMVLGVSCFEFFVKVVRTMASQAAGRFHLQGRAVCGVCMSVVARTIVKPRAR